LWLIETNAHPERLVESLLEATVVVFWSLSIAGDFGIVSSRFTIF